MTCPFFCNISKRMNVLTYNTVKHLMKKQFILAAFILSLVFTVSNFAQNLPTIPLYLEVPNAAMPFKADGQMHLLYELHVTSFANRAIELTQVDVFNEELSLKPLGIFKDSELLGVIDYAGITKKDTEKKIINSGERMVLFLQVTLDGKTLVPNVLRHRIHFKQPNSEGPVRTIEHKGFEVITKTPPIISPPLRGSGWGSFNGASNTSDHRRTIIPFNGTATLAQRFAIDWGKLGADGLPFKNDGKKNSDFYGYGEDLLAVADATVVGVKDGIPDNDMAAGKMAVRITMDTIGGNYVVLDIGNGYYAFYAHMIPGSLKVKMGDKVKVGDVLGKLGNSGNSDAPHLHFHITNDINPMSSEGIPYLIRSFEVQGKIDSPDALFVGKAWKPKANSPKDMRFMEIPTENSVIRFPN